MQKVGKIAFALVTGVIGLLYITRAVNYTVIDNLHLVIHEAGHLLLTFCGEFIYILGGSLMQLAVPITFIVYFYRRRDRYAMGFALIWLGLSAINLSYYIADARAKILPLLGGEGSIHDWEYLLSKLHLLSADAFLGGLTFIVGAAVVITGVVIMIRDGLSRTTEMV
ncbi:hypothetical protein KC614_00515 [candidate division WWE3 bacterium]|uniref:Uncharacterized protein n=1 Tax=candidate division WWE3 bacterium TaxID=2053526 RepID=A0A955LJZ9_UNCKA|nr:hypothetical protein [candidate division WWE3 bacterium]